MNQLSRDASCNRLQDGARTVERGGTVYQQNTANIGKPQEKPCSADAMRMDADAMRMDADAMRMDAGAERAGVTCTQDTSESYLPDSDR